MALRNIPQAIWIGSAYLGGQIAEGEEIFAAGAKIFCFREGITRAYCRRLRKWGGKSEGESDYLKNK